MSLEPKAGVERLRTPTDLSRKATAKVAAAVNPLIADAMALYFKTKNYHWHMTGSDFQEYHELLDDHADALYESWDVLAERLRKLGETTIRSVGHIAKLSSVKDDDDAYVAPKEMMARLLADDLAMAKAQRAAIETCDGAGDTPTGNILQDILDKTERRVWFLAMLLADGA
jgi:starvation-inducible DNA-binding protein